MTLDKTGLTTLEWYDLTHIETYNRWTMTDGELEDVLWDILETARRYRFEEFLTEAARKEWAKNKMKNRFGSEE